MPRRAAFCVAFLAAVAAGLAPGAAGRAGRPLETVPAAEIVADLRRHQPFLRTGVLVPERLDLSGIVTVEAPFRCRACRFAGGIDASDVVFARTVDLAGSTIEGSAIFRGTTFRGPAVFVAAEDEEVECYTGRERWRFGGRADFSLAVFEGLAGFDSAAFKTRAIFDQAQFHRRAHFAEACFDGRASFRGVDFGARASFTQAQFRVGAGFGGASFAQGATFLAATFSGSPTETAASFDGTTSARDLDFTFVHFDVVTEYGSKPPPPDERADAAVFSYLAASGSVIFRDASFAKGYGIAMDRVHIDDLVLDVDVAAQVDNEEDEDNERAVLKLIESSAKERGDLSAANDAHYRVEALDGRHYWPPVRALDYVFYRGVSGYLVRPLRPLLVLLALLVLFALVRTLRRRPRTDFRARGHDLLADVLDTFGAVVPRRSEETAPSLGRRLEIFVYRVLVVVAFLALANANPTLREMVDSLV